MQVITDEELWTIFIVIKKHLSENLQKKIKSSNRSQLQKIAYCLTHSISDATSRKRDEKNVNKNNEDQLILNKKNYSRKKCY